MHAYNVFQETSLVYNGNWTMNGASTRTEFRSNGIDVVWHFSYFIFKSHSAFLHDARTQSIGAQVHSTADCEKR